MQKQGRRSREWKMSLRRWRSQNWSHTTRLGDFLDGKGKYLEIFAGLNTNRFTGSKSKFKGVAILSRGPGRCKGRIRGEFRTRAHLPPPPSCDLCWRRGLNRKYNRFGFIVSLLRATFRIRWTELHLINSYFSQTHIQILNFRIFKIVQRCKHWD
jgi:hypothetical protein